MDEMNHSNRRPVRKPTRIPDFNYASAGMYFITICTQHMEARFGQIDDGLVSLNDAGMMIVSTWQDKMARYPGAVLDAFVVMPDHMHAIVFLGTDPELSNPGVTLSQIVQSFKSVSTVEYTRGVQSGMYPAFDRVLWQRGFHDRILRNDQALNAARTYIEGNPGRMHERIDTNRTPRR